MRLLNTETLQLESFLGAEIDIPNYAILSHTWEKAEISFQDIQTKNFSQLRRDPAIAKVEQSCRQAYRDGFDYIWIDTCCIDKSSSAELSEAINSMFKWYQQSSRCYVFLSDFQAQLITTDSSVFGVVEEALDPDDTSFFNCRWFDRGWTLQELIAPRGVDFFDKNWVRFGTRDGSLLDRLCTRTRIWPHVFDEPRCPCLQPTSSTVRDGLCMACGFLDTLPQTLDTFAVSIKMSWAANRITTRKEDAAYCLLGLFNINIPMLYGEGDKAFLRLQDAIVRQSKDQSILLWRAVPSSIPRERALGCLAPAAEHFRDPVPIIGRRVFSNLDRQYEADFFGNMAPMEMSDTALKVNIWLCPCTVHTWDSQTAEYTAQSLRLGILDLARDSDYLVRPAILLERMGAFDLCRRVYNQIIIDIDPRRSSASLHFTVDGTFYETADDIDPKELIVITIKLSLDKASKEDVGILLQQSPINAVKRLESSPGDIATGPLYVIINQDKRFPCQTDCGGSYPPFNRYSARATQISAPWVWKRCEHRENRHFGGLHFLNFAFNVNTEPTRVYVAIAWGTYKDVFSSEDLFWCRIFDMRCFMKSAWTSPEDLRPSQLYGEAVALAPMEIQRRLENQRHRLSKSEYKELAIEQPGGAKRLFPNVLRRDWEADHLLNVLRDNSHVVNLVARISRTQGLGRTLFELTVDV
ncbi:heterokaryon incompatibility protein-domain-containing protein, partial [Thelonectria olida]